MSERIRVLLVDDEPPGRSILRRLLDPEPDVEIVGECENGAEAIRAVQLLAPALVFLDIQMPEMSGFDVLDDLLPPLPLVVFVTAYDQHAIRAFEVHALDYVLKPIDPKRLQLTLQRVRHMRQSASAHEVQDRLTRLLAERQRQSVEDRLIVREDNRIFFLLLSEIEWVEAEGNYVALHARKSRHLIREPISHLEERLDARFQRISRSVIVNLDFTREIQPWFRGEYKVLLRDGTELKLTSPYRDDLFRRFSAGPARRP